MFGAHPILHIGHWLHQLVLGEPRRVGLEMLLAVRCQANQTGFNSLGSTFS